MKKRIFALFVSLTLILGLLPCTAFAAEPIELTVWTSEYDAQWLEKQMNANQSTSKNL